MSARTSIGEKAAEEKAQDIVRRPIKARNTAWARSIARALAGLGIRPNAISVASSVFAAVAGLALWSAGHVTTLPASFMLVLAAAGMQLRLLCNLFDGMVAIEGGFKTPAGELFNELPDRFSDIFIFVGAAYAIPAVSSSTELGWTAAVLSVTTAYVRALGGTMGAGQHFCGPMAKQQRMAIMTGACLLGAVAPSWPMLRWSVPVALGLVSAGCLLTIVRRCRRIAATVEGQC